MIYTFYSYKGGVGRSMALANVAEWLYLQGLRVIVIDWDLEAPGLENFFYQSEKDLNAVRSQLGLIDVLLAYKRVFPLLRLPDRKGDSNSESETKRALECQEILRENLDPISDVLYPIHALQTRPDGKVSALWLLSAGWRSGDRFQSYAQAVQGFDWTDFYASFEGEFYFDWMREQLNVETQADVVLIDSRTGVTEMGGVCTRQLADIVVSFCVPNAQNLSGVETMAESFARPEIIEKRGRDLDIVVVPTRIDMNELDYRKAFEDKFHDRLDKFTPSTFAAVKSSFWDLQIQYIPKYAYSEKLAINDSSAPELSRAYQKLAAHLALLANGKSGLQIRAAMAEELQREFQDRLPGVFISTMDDEGRAIARELRERFSQNGVALWPDLSELKVKGDTWQQITAILDQAKAMVLVMTPEAMQSDLVRKQWRYARQQGVSVYLVARNAAALESQHVDRESMRSIGASASGEVTRSRQLPESPRWLQGADYYDVDSEWVSLASVLQRPTLTTRVPFMVPDLPEGYVTRPMIMMDLRSALLDSNGSAAPSGAAAWALWGPAGCGKTAAATEFCLNEDVNAYFEDGIMWVTLGEKPNLLAELTKLYAALTGERPNFVDEEEAAKAWSSKLSGKHCLLVLSDVLNVEQLRFFTPAADSRCMRLLTTRDLNVAYAAGAQPVALAQMTEAQAMEVLGADLRVGDEDEPSLKTLSHHLGNWPLALGMAKAELRKRTSHGADLSAALVSLAKDVSEKGILVLDQIGANGKGLISQKLESALANGVPLKEDFERYIQLAFFPADAAVTLKEVSDLWGLDEHETEGRVHHLSEVALLDYDTTKKTIRLQSAMRSYLLSRMPDKEGVNDKLEAAFAHFSPVRQEAARRVLTRLVRLSTPGEQGIDTRQQLKISDLDATSQMAIESLVEARLVTLQADQGTVQIANEAYLKAWKRLGNWINDDRDFLWWRQQLRFKIAEWQETSRDQGALLSGVPLDLAARWRQQRPDELNEAEKAYIDESVRESERNLEAQQQAQQAKQQVLLTKQRQLWVVPAVVVLVLALMGIGVWQWTRFQRAETRERAELIAREQRIQAEAFNTSGTLELENKRYDQALNNFSEALEIKPDYFEAYLNRGRTYAGTGNLVGAIADYTKAIELIPNKPLDPNLPLAYFERAELFRLDGNDDKAIEDYRSAVRLKPDYWNAYLNLGFAHENKNDFDAAISDYSKIIDSHPDQFEAPAYLHRGAAYLRKKDKESAANDLQKAIALSADATIREPATLALKSIGFKQSQLPQQTPVAPTVFLQYNDSKDGPVLDAIRSSLESSGIKALAKDLSTGKTTGDVRYYYPEDKPNAETIRKIVSDTLVNPKVNKLGIKPTMRLVYLGDRYSVVPRGNIEVWIPQLQKLAPPVDQLPVEVPKPESRKYPMKAY
jgi:tetratricopeptide (TPR) repeat protein